MIGSGKSTIGVPLAREMGLDFYDLDREMDRALGYSFHRLVREKGWLAFRELEYSICKRFAQLDNALICLGGGTVRYEWNMDVLKGTGYIVDGIDGGINQARQGRFPGYQHHRHDGIFGRVPVYRRHQ